MFILISSSKTHLVITLATKCLSGKFLLRPDEIFLNSLRALALISQRGCSYHGLVRNRRRLAGKTSVTSCVLAVVLVIVDAAEELGAELSPALDRALATLRPDMHRDLVRRRVLLNELKLRAFCLRRNWAST